MAPPPAEAIAVAQAMDALAGGGFAAPRLLSARVRHGVARGLASEAALPGSCLPR